MKIKKIKSKLKTRISKFKLKHRLFFVASLILIIGVPILLYLAFIATKPTEAAWYNNNWLYRQTTAITNNGSAQTDFQVAVTLNTSSLISAGKMKSDCSDIRLTDPNGVNLPYWIENGTNACNTSTTAIWTKIPSIPTGSSYIYVYYGNPSAQSISNGKKVFQFFDDFSGDLSQWVVPSGCSVTTASGALVISSSLSCDQTPMYEKVASLSDTTGYIVDFRGKFSSGGSGRLQVYQRYNPANGNAGRFWTSGTSTLYQEYISGSFGGTTNVGNSGMSADTYANISVQVNGTNNTFSANGTTIGSATTSDSSLTSQSNLAVALGEYNTAVTYDDVRIRKYSATPPTVSTPSNEEQAPGPIAYWKFDEGAGTIAHDSTEQHNDATISNVVWQPKDLCVRGKCLAFNGSSSSLSTSPISSLTTNFTFSAWIYLTKGSTWQGVYQSGTATHFWRINIDANNKLDFTKDSVADYASSSTVPLNQWVHVAVVKSGDSGANVTFYINGVRSGTASVSTVVAPSGTAYIGSQNGASAVFNGDIDEPKIYNYARSQNQIQADYLGGLKGSNAVLGAATDQNLSNGLVGYWKMDEPSWTNDCSTKSVIDSSGNGKNGKSCPNSTGPTGGGVGKFGNAGVFDNTNDYVQVDNPGLPTQDFTYSFWEKTTAANPQFLMAANGFGANEFWVKVNGANSKLSVQLHNDTAINAKGVLNDGVWHLVTITRSGSTVSIYQDGALDTTGTDGSTLSFSTCPLMIGVDVDSGCTGNLGEYMNGSMDELRIYNRALSPAEVQQLYNFAPGPVAYYNFNENQGASVHDISGNNNTGTWNGSGPTHWVQGKYGSAGNFNGSSDYVVSSSLTNLPSGDKPKTIEAWFRHSTCTGTDGGAPGTIGGFGDPSTGHNFQIEACTSDFYILGWSGASDWDTGVATAPYKDNNWHYITVTYDGTTTTLYIDGKSKASTTSKTWNTTLTRIVIGQEIDLAGRNFNGQIDDFRIYNYARTQKQVLQDMNAGAPIITSSGVKQSAIAYYKFDEGTGITVRNSGTQGSTLNGTISGATWTNAGKFGRALSFNGSSSYVSGSDTSLPSGTSPSTQTLWFKANSTCSNQVLFVYGTGSAHHSRGITCNSNTSILLFGYADDYSFTVPAMGTTWHYITSVFDGSTITLYFDGKYIGSNTTSWNTTLSGTWYIGKNFGASNYFNGTIDEVKVYPFALTASEVALDYNHSAALTLGSSGTDTSGNADNSQDRAFCPPGDTTATCSPVGQWDFSENQGTTVKDISGNNNSGTWNGTGSHWTQGKVGNGGNFNGTNDYVNVPDSSTIRPSSAISIGAWFNASDIKKTAAQTAKSQTILRKTNNYILYIYDSTGSQLDLDFYVYGPNTRLSYPINGNFTNNTWYYIEATYDGSTMKLYKNGVLVTSTSASGTINTSNSYSLGIGANPPNLADSYFQGKIDQVRIYNYARSAAEVALDFNDGKPIAQYKFDECQGSTAHDVSGNGNDGTITIGGSGTQTSVGTCQTSATAWGNGAIGKLGHSLNFDGTDDYVSVPDAASLDTTSDLSLSTWIYPTSYSSNSFGSGIGSTILDRNETGNTSGYAIGIQNTGKIWWWPADHQDKFSTNTVPLNIWSHIVITYSGGTVKMYINGILDSSQSSVAPQSTTSVFKIGAKSWITGWFKGQIDMFQFYNYALTAQQIKTLYNNGAVNY